MFRSARRQVVYPQAEHARLAAALALHWGNDAFARPPLPFPSFVRGVALHDRGYGQLDADGIGEVDPDRWIAIQEAGFTPTGDDPVVDLVVATHVQRLVSWGRSDADQAVAARMAAELPLYQAAAGVDAATAADADAITNLCDMVAFDFCVERETSGSVAMAPAAGADPVAVSYRLDGGGGIVLSPWPLGITELSGLAIAFRSENYPRVLDPVVVEFHVRPGS